MRYWCNYWRIASRWHVDRFVRGRRLRPSARHDGRLIVFSWRSRSEVSGEKRCSSWNGRTLPTIHSNSSSALRGFHFAVFFKSLENVVENGHRINVFVGKVVAEFDEGIPDLNRTTFSLRPWG